MDPNQWNDSRASSSTGNYPPSYTPPGTPPRRAKPSSSAGSDIDRLVNVLDRFIPRTQHSSQPFINQGILPEFDPVKKNITAERWLEKVNMYGAAYGWNEKNKLFMAASKLRTTAHEWYTDFNVILTWEVFVRELKLAFPERKTWNRTA